MAFFHENAGTLNHRLPYFGSYRQLGRVNLLAVAYRGYSGSTGTPTEEGLQLDSAAIVKFAVGLPEAAGGLFLHGRSLGGAVSIYAAASPAHR